MILQPARAALPLMLAALLAAACSGPPPTGPDKPKKGPDQAAPEPSPTASATPTAAPTPTSGATPVAAATRFGRIVGPDGLPAKGVQVRAVPLTAPGASGFRVLEDLPARLLAAPITATTDEDGYFDLAIGNGRPVNLEAALGDAKALRLAVPGDAKGLVIQLQPVGTLAGKVGSKDAAVTNFEGVDVYIPGTSYVGKTDAAGRFAISGVPAGRYVVVAAKAGLGKAKAPRVEVQAGKTSEAPRLELVQTPPTIKLLDPPNGGPGAKLRLTGDAFGASTGETIQVQLNGTLATSAKRLDDFTVELEVPAAATTGDMVVTVGGVLSNAVPFQVIKELVLSPRPFKMKVGDTQRLTVTATDTAGTRVVAPAVEWKVEGTALAYADGLLTAATAGRGTLKAISGTLEARLPIDVATTWPTVSTLAGGERGFQDGPGPEARFDEPIAVAVDSQGNIYVCDNATQGIRKLSKADNRVVTVAGGVGGDADGPGPAARFANPNGIVIAKDGTMYVTEWTNHKVRKITPDFTVSTFVGGGGAGNVDGKGTQAKLRNPKGIAMDDAGNLYVTEMGNHTIRKISPGGVAQRWGGDGFAGDVDGNRTASRFNEPTGIAVDAKGNIYFCDSLNHKVKRIDAATDEITTIAGTGVAGYKDGPGAQAQFGYPVGIAVSKEGDVYISEGSGHRIRKIVAGTGEVVTVAGTGTAGIRDGYEYDAMFNEPGLIALDADGNLIVADRMNNRIRQVIFK